MDPILAQIMLWPVSWVPEGWLACNGQLLSVQQYAALYSLIGITYGGDGQNNFALPNLNGRVPVGVDGATFLFGKTGGSATSNVVINGTATGAFTLNANQLPAHTHTVGGATVPVAIPVNSASGASNTDTPGTTTILTKPTVTNAAPAINTTAKAYTTAAANTTLQPFNATVPGSTTGSTGIGAQVQVNMAISGAAGQASTIQPWASMYFIIAVQGNYPPRP
jgi:microcystin-dependent protein